MAKKRSSLFFALFLVLGLTLAQTIVVRQQFVVRQPFVNRCHGYLYLSLDQGCQPYTLRAKTGLLEVSILMNFENKKTFQEMLCLKLYFIIINLKNVILSHN